MTIHHSPSIRRTFTKRRNWAVLATPPLVFLLVSCFATQGAPTIEQPAVAAPSFWIGLWHGFIGPIAFFVSLFSDHVRIYSVPNAGRWYDFGFMLGISGFSGGIFAGSRTPRRKQ